jgi:hypothetical protein
MPKYNNDRHVESVTKFDFIQIRKFGTENAVWTPVSRMMTLFTSQETAGFDFVFIDSANDGVTTPVFTPDVKTIAMYNNGWVWQWTEDNSWVVQGQLQTGGGGVEYLDDLLDVDAPTPTTGDVLYFDGTEWVAQQITVPDELDDLSDVDFTVAPTTGNVLYFDGTKWVAQTLTIPTTFIALTDTPSAYTGNAGNVPTVNSGETALEFKPRGDQMFWGTEATAPSNTLGNDGDEWVTSVGRVYEKVSGSWTLKSSRFDSGFYYDAGLDVSSMYFLIRYETGASVVAGSNQGIYNGYLNNSVWHSGTTGSVQLGTTQTFRGYVYANYTGALTLRFPTNSASSSHNIITVKNVNTGVCTISRSASDTVTTFEGATTYVLNPGETVSFQYDHANTNWQLLWKYTSATAPNTFIALTDTPSTYTARALPATNENGDALIWSKMFYDAAAVRFRIAETNTSNKRADLTHNGLYFFNTSGNAMASVYTDFESRGWVQADNLTNISGTNRALFIYATNNIVQTLRLTTSISVFDGSGSYGIQSNHGIFNGGNKIFYGNIMRPFILASGFDPSSGSTHEYWAYYGTFGGLTGSSRTVTVPYIGIVGYGVCAVLSISTDNTGTGGSISDSNGDLYVKGNKFIIGSVTNYTDKENIIVHEIDTASTPHGQFGFYAHKSNGGVFKQPLPTYADNDAAVAAGLAVDEWYKTATGEVRIVV